MAKANLKAADDDVTLVDVGENARIEKRNSPETDEAGTVKLDKDGLPSYKWIVYEKVATGLQLKAGAPKNAEELTDAHVEEFGTHPVIKDAAGAGIKTTSPFIWVPHGEPMDSKDEALDAAHELG